MEHPYRTSAATAPGRKSLWCRVGLHSWFVWKEIDWLYHWFEKCRRCGAVREHHIPSL